MAFKVALSHLKLVKRKKGEKTYGEFKGHLAWYFKNFSGASKIRSKIMLANNYNEIERILTSISNKK